MTGFTFTKPIPVIYALLFSGSLSYRVSEETARRLAEIKPEGRTPYTSKVPEGTPSIQDDPPALEVSARRATLSTCHLWSDALVNQGSQFFGIPQVFSHLQCLILVHQNRRAYSRFSDANLKLLPPRRRKVDPVVTC